VGLRLLQASMCAAASPLGVVVAPVQAAARELLSAVRDEEAPLLADLSDALAVLERALASLEVDDRAHEGAFVGHLRTVLADYAADCAAIRPLVARLA
jgi:hypothetical protein